MKRGNNRLAPFLAVVAFLFLFGLSTGIVLGFVLPVVVVVLRFGWCWRGCGSFFELAYPGLNFIHEANVLVILHHSARSLVISAANGAGPQIKMPQISQPHARQTQRH